jgi:hypothetical protein
VIIPLNAFLSIFQIGWILLILLSSISFYSLYKERQFLLKKSGLVLSQLNIQVILLALLFIFSFILLFKQSLYVPANNLDQFLVWPDTYNALAQAGEITHHGPGIFPFVADAQVPLKYHWGAFSLGSFISLLGNFSLVISIFKSRNRTRSATQNNNFKKDVIFSVTSFLLNLTFILLNLPLSVILFEPNYIYSNDVFLLTFYIYYFSYGCNFYILYCTNSIFRKELNAIFLSVRSH